MRLIIAALLTMFSLSTFAVDVENSKQTASPEERRAAIKRVEEFEKNMRASDPRHFVKLDMIKKAIPVVAALPPSQWENQIVFLYSALTEIDEKGVGLDVYNSLMTGRPYLPYAAKTSRSGHQAGYDWAEDNEIDDEDDCDGNSESFNEGCREYVEEQE